MKNTFLYLTAGKKVQNEGVLLSVSEPAGAQFGRASFLSRLQK